MFFKKEDTNRVQFTSIFQVNKTLLAFIAVHHTYQKKKVNLSL
jgi:hypothetical protein